MNCGGFFDIDVKERRLAEIETAMQNPDVWNNHEEMQKYNKEKVVLEREIKSWDELRNRVDDGFVLLEMAVEEGDEATFKDLLAEMSKMSERIEELEVKSLLKGELDQNSSYVSINSGAGGTEACDWAQILFRMFTRYAEKSGFNVEILSMTEGEEAGIKSVTMLIEGPFAYGYMRAETGVHRLVRISPFDSNARRHTSFASVYAWPEIEGDINIEIKDEDIRIDTYRASGAGGQHINRTDSAVRITHEPSGIVVQCQNQRSQHANKDRAFKMLKAALYEKELEKQKAELEGMTAEKKANEWGSQIRSYVLHPYQMVKDHRTDFESGDPSSVLDGDLQKFIEAYLKKSALEEKSV
jgi:peptide chain release factor 2